MTVSRRQLLVGGAALAFVTACSSDDGGGDDADPTTTAGADQPSALLVSLPLQGVLTLDGPQRVPLLLADANGPIADGLVTQTFQVRANSGEPVELEVDPHGDGLPVPYYPVVFTPEAAGVHEITVVGLDQVNPVSFEVGDSAIPGPGQPMPSLQTPTTRDARGVDPICTRDPACALHEVSLADALGSGPVALSISTPEFCQTAVCGPVLDVLLDALGDHPDVTGIHAEVYADPRGNPNPTTGGLAPTPEALALSFEPTLYLIDSSGTIATRLDTMYDRTELDAALSELT
jgi:hypothetical protein